MGDTTHPVLTLAHESIRRVDFADADDPFLDPHVEGETVAATKTTLERVCDEAAA